MLRLIASLALISIGSMAAADASSSQQGYTTLAPQPTVTRTVSAPQYVFVPSMSFSSCCCGQTAFIQGVVITTPSITTQSWGANG